MEAKHTPGPWFVEPCSEGRNCNRWTVARRNPDGRYEFESLLDRNGRAAYFRSPAEARAAIAKAAGSTT